MKKIAMSNAERQRKFVAKRRLAARPAYLAVVAASLARCQAVLAREERANPGSRYSFILTKYIAGLMAVLSLPPQSNVTTTPRRGHTG